jgi:hypothetical protein
MRRFPVILGRGLGILLGIALTVSAHGQAITVAQEAQPKAPPAKGAAVEQSAPASVYQMEVYQGPNRIVHYVASGDLSTSDRLAAYEMERAENDLAYVHNLQRLKQQYVNSERVLEPQRRYVQEQLYGTSISYGRSFTGYGGGGGYGGFGYGGRGYFPYVFGSYGNASLGNGFGGFAGSTSLDVTRSLQFGMGDEGILKNALAKAILTDASPDYAAQALRNYDTAVARAASSPTLAKALSLRKSPATYAAYEPTFTKGANVVVWVGNDKYAGTVKDDHPGWVVIQTAAGEVTVRKSEITRSETPAKPAANPDK